MYACGENRSEKYRPILNLRLELVKYVGGYDPPLSCVRSWYSHLFFIEFDVSRNATKHNYGLRDRSSDRNGDY